VTNLATIDIGTNTTLLLVATSRPPFAVLAERAEVTRLGRGIGKDGGLGADGIARTLAVLRDYAELARQHQARIAAIGTEALRRAPNAQDFLRPAAEILGGEIEVIDGDREAALTYRAVAASFPGLAPGALAVVDIGGGSTEIVLAQSGDDTGEARFHVSLPIGSVRLTERHIHADPPAADDVDAIARDVDAAIAGVPFPAQAIPLVGVAGTVTTLAAMAQDLASYDPARVHGFRLRRDELTRQLARLRDAPQADREKMPGLDPRRADVILAGAVILDRIARRLGATDVIVSDRGIRWGLLYELCDALAREGHRA
jgi:exopolyphosphatase/guanosine-5'-triphosphate,3'-diphosphate pyrophosphatase